MSRNTSWLMVLWAGLVACGDDAKDDASNAVGAATAMFEAAKEMKKVGQAAEEASKAAEAQAKDQVPEGATEEEAQQFIEHAKAMAAMQALQKSGGNGPITNWRQLEPFLPETLGDFKSSGKLKGSTSNAGAMKVTTVRRRYEAGERSADVTITDTFLSPMMKAPFKMAAVFNEDSSDGYKKGSKIAGNTAMLEWREPSKRSQATLLVGDRFVVSVKVRNTGVHDDASKLAGAIKLGDLSKVEGKAPEGQ